MAHFLEHMCFKGTPTRTAKAIASQVDQMGGRINAYTAKEYTCYYVTVLPQFGQKALKLLCDMYLNSVLDPSEIERERSVVLEEISMVHDTPDDWVHDLFYSTIWADSTLGRPILGTAESLAEIDRDNLALFRDQYFNGEDVIVSIAGPEKIMDQLMGYTPKLLSLPTRSAPSPSRELGASTYRMRCDERDVQQLHFCLGTSGVSYTHDDHYAVALLASMLGGGMSSRLFQQIREKKGWAYSIFAYPSFYQDAGLFVISGGINKAKLVSTLRTVFKIFDQFKTRCPIAELDKVKQQFKGNMAIGLEKSSSMMMWMAKSQLYYDCDQDVADVYDRIDTVNPADIVRLARQLFDPSSFALSTVGPMGPRHAYDGQSFASFCQAMRLG